MNGMDFNDFGGMNLHDIFAQMFGGGGSPFGGFGGGMESQFDVNRPQPGKDLQIELTLDFMDAVNGVQKEIKINRLNECNECGSTGMEPGSVPTKCTQCNGTGRVCFQYIILFQLKHNIINNNDIYR